MERHQLINHTNGDDDFLNSKNSDNRCSLSSSSSSSSSSSKDVDHHSAVSSQQQRPYPWNAFSDTTYTIAGFVILSIIVVPTMMIIALSNIVGYALQYALYDYNRVGRSCLEWMRHLQRRVCQWVGYYILLDPRDSSYLGWMTWGNVVQPLLFMWVCQRYRQKDRLEFWVFLLYHLIRVGPRHQCFAHHATLVHKEGHAASKVGFFCNPWILLKGTTRKGQQHCCRVPLSKPIRRWITDHAVAGIAGILYGTIPNHYATAHNKIHHRWHNDTGDVHTNMDVDRSILSNYLIYLPRFVGYWTGITPLLLFASRGEYDLLRRLLGGMVYYYGVGVWIGWYMRSITFYWAYILYPMLEAASFLGVIAYLWHCFSEEDDPTNQYINSITILRGGNNVWNEDYHVVHHHEPNVHWSDMAHSFEVHLDRYISCRATVFGDCEQGLLIAWIFGSDWDSLTDHFIDLQYVFSNGDHNYHPDKRMTVRQIAEWERQRQQQEQKLLDSVNDGHVKDTSSSCDDQQQRQKEELVDSSRMEHHHQDVKAMLLRRLRYHYMGTRKDEITASIQKYNERLSANVRDWDEGKKDS